MSSLTFYSEAADGWIRGLDGSLYAVARSTSESANIADNDIWIGQFKGADIRVFRCYLSFDTSALPNDAVPSSATLYVTAFADASTYDFNIKVYRFAWTEALNGASQEANYDGAYGGGATLEGTLRNTVSGWVPGVEYNMAVDTAGINLTGDTKYVLVSGQDVGNVEPIGSERVEIYSGDSGSGKPRLVVEYSMPVTQTLTLQWDLAGIATATKEFTWDLHNSATKTLTLQWDLRGTVCATKTFTWDIRGAVCATKTFTWDLLSLTFTKTFTWSVLRIGRKLLTLTWTSGGSVTVTKEFIWGLITPVPLGRVVSLPQTEYTLEIAEVSCCKPYLSRRAMLAPRWISQSNRMALR